MSLGDIKDEELEKKYKACSYIIPAVREAHVDKLGQTRKIKIWFRVSVELFFAIFQYYVPLDMKKRFLGSILMP